MIFFLEEHAGQRDSYTVASRAIGVSILPVVLSSSVISQNSVGLCQSDKFLYGKRIVGVLIWMLGEGQFPVSALDFLHSSVRRNFEDFIWIEFTKGFDTHDFVEVQKGEVEETQHDQNPHVKGWGPNFTSIFPRPS